MRCTTATGAAFAAGLLLGGGAYANEPRSAIPWLSESIHTASPPSRPAPRLATVPGETPGTAPEAAPGSAPDAAGDPGAITVTPLGDVQRDAVGLLPPERTGFARALWGPASALKVRGLILSHPDRGVPEARALFRRMLLAEADPPPGSGRAAPVLLARIDRLLEVGALLEAEALLEIAGPDTPELFRRWFDVALLLDRAQGPCAALRQNPTLSPTLPARVFCLARGGDWNAAEITLTLGRDVGELTEVQEAALARFLDPHLFEDTPDPPVPDPLTPLDFVLREAVGLPRPAGALPAAFLHFDLTEYAPMRTRIEAAERLVPDGAAPPEVLFDAYRAGAPAASGGPWDRAAAVQTLDTALAAGDAAAIAAALAEADRRLAERGLRVVFARTYAEPLAAFDPASLDAGTRGRLFELLLLAESYQAAGLAAGLDPDRRTRVLLALAGLPQAGDPAEGAEPRERAALAGMTLVAPAGDREQHLARLLEEGRQGEALLEVLDLLAEGPQVDPPALQAALWTLRQAGLMPSARKIALQTLLLPAPD
jgi:hypothetical protein